MKGVESSLAANRRETETLMAGSVIASRYLFFDLLELHEQPIEDVRFIIWTSVAVRYGSASLQTARCPRRKYR